MVVRIQTSRYHYGSRIRCTRELYEYEIYMHRANDDAFPVIPHWSKYDSTSIIGIVQGSGSTLYL
jgi:hypothetical protein